MTVKCLTIIELCVFEKLFSKNSMCGIFFTSKISYMQFLNECFLFLFSKQFALTKKDEGDLEEPKKKELIDEEDDFDSEDLEMFYPTNQWQAVRPGKLNIGNNANLFKFGFCITIADIFSSRKK